MPDLAAIKDYLEAISYIAIILGLPTALYQFIRSKRKEELDREYGTYNALDEKYLEFQRLCFDLPSLDIFDINDKSPAKLTELEAKQELIAFTMLFSIFERAYLMYFDQDGELKAKQWTGWDDYIASYCRRQNFRDAWEISGNTFDTDYQAFMTDILSKNECRPASA